MTLLSIFHTGGLTLVLTLVFLFLEFIFGRMVWQEMRARKIEGIKKPIWKMMGFRFCAALLLLYVIAMLNVASDYFGV